METLPRLAESHLHLSNLSTQLTVSNIQSLPTHTNKRYMQQATEALSYHNLQFQEVLDTAMCIFFSLHLMTFVLLNHSI